MEMVRDQMGLFRRVELKELLDKQVESE